MPSLTERARLEALARAALGAAPDAAFDRFAQMVRRYVVAPVALVSLVDDTRQVLPGLTGLEGPWAQARELPLSHSFCQYVVTSGGSLVIQDARTHPLVAGSPAIPDLNVIAYAGMPLTDVEGNVLGSLCAIDDQPRFWTLDELDLLADLAAACSSELRMRLAAHAADDAASRLALLSEVTRAVVTTLDAGEALGRLTRLVVPGLGDWCTAGLVDDEGLVRQVSSKHDDPERLADLEHFALRQSQHLDAQAPTRMVLRTGEAAVLQRKGADRLLGELEADLALIDRLGVESVLVVPFRARGGTLGYLTLGRGPGQLPYGEDALQDALDIGRRMGLALDNAELFRQQQHNAESLQRSLLTRLPEPDDLDVVARYLPAADSAAIGGDWYDAFVQPGGSSMLVIGDVMGHDMAAAALMGQLRNLVRGTAYDRDESPAALLQRVDRAMRGLQVEILATVVIARIDPPEPGSDTRRLRWSNAGHPPPVHLDTAGAVRLLDTSGDLLLGVDPETTRIDHEMFLAPGSTVLLYTDGLVERRDSPLDHGLARLRQALAGLTDRPLERLCDELLSRMLPQRSEDDIALVALRTKPAGIRKALRGCEP